MHTCAVHGHHGMHAGAVTINMHKLGYIFAIYLLRWPVHQSPLEAVAAAAVEHQLRSASHTV